MRPSLWPAGCGRIQARDRRLRNLRHELRAHAGAHWTFGYPLVLVVMVAICAVPYRYFKRVGWLE
jgi:hypothetical protein